MRKVVIALITVLVLIATLDHFCCAPQRQLNAIQRRAKYEWDIQAREQREAIEKAGKAPTTQAVIDATRRVFERRGEAVDFLPTTRP